MDAGDALLAHLPRRGAPGAGDLDKAETIMRGQGLMGVDAMAVGELDLAIGLQKLADLATQTSQTLLCANLTVRGVRPFAARRRITVGGVNVGLTAVLAPPKEDARSARWFRQAGFRIQDPLAAARSQVGALVAGDAELVVLIAHVGLRRAEDLAREVKGIHLIIVGHSGRRVSPPVRVGKTLLVESGRRGRNLGHVQLRLGPDWTADSALADDSTRHELYDEITHDLGRLTRSRPVSEKDPRLIRVRALAHRLEALSPPASAHTLIARLVLLDESIPDDPAVRGLVDASRSTWRAGGPGRAGRPVRASRSTWHAGRPGRARRPDRAGRPGRPERPDRPDRP